MTPRESFYYSAGTSIGLILGPIGSFLVSRWGAICFGGSIPDYWITGILFSMIAGVAMFISGYLKLKRGRRQYGRQ